MNAESSQQNAFIAGVVAELKKRRRALIISAVVLVVYALAGFFVAPWALKGVMQDTVSEQYNATLDIDRLRVNPFALSVEVSGLKLHDPDGAPHVGWQTLYVNFQLSSIFRRAWTFREVRLNGVKVCNANIDRPKRRVHRFRGSLVVPP